MLFSIRNWDTNDITHILRVSHAGFKIYDFYFTNSNAVPHELTLDSWEQSGRILARPVRRHSWSSVVSTPVMSVFVFLVVSPQPAAVLPPGLAPANITTLLRLRKLLCLGFTKYPQLCISHIHYVRVTTSPLLFYKQITFN